MSKSVLLMVVNYVLWMFCEAVLNLLVFSLVVRHHSILQFWQRKWVFIDGKVAL